MALLLKLLLAAVAVVGLVQGVRGCQERLREQGRVEVREQWTTADNARISAERQATIDKQRTEREEEQRMARAAEEKALAQSRRDEALLKRADAAERDVGRMRLKLAEANARSTERRAAGTCPAADAEADEAAKARELLGRCSVRYAAMGKRASELASQVIGLQDHVVVVQPEAAALLEEEAP